MAVTHVTIAYCTVPDVKRFMSQIFGVDSADHNDDGLADTDVIEDAIDAGTEEINISIGKLYAPADIANSKLANRWCVLLSSCALSMNRGNEIPAVWERERERVNELMHRIGNGELPLPGIDTKYDPRPSMSNVRVDRRHSQSTIRVTPNNSTDAPTELTQDKVHSAPTVYD